MTTLVWVKCLLCGASHQTDSDRYDPCDNCKSMLAQKHEIESLERAICLHDGVSKRIGRAGRVFCWINLPSGVTCGAMKLGAC